MADTTDPVAVARARLEAARENLELAKRYHSARHAHEQAVTARKAAALLGPLGLRRAALRRALDPVEARIKALSGQLFEPGMVVGLDLDAEDLPLTFDGMRFDRAVTKYDPWSSIRLMSRAMVQVLVAEHDGSRVIIIDRAEALSGDNLRRLARVILAAKLSALVLRVTDSAKRDGPDPLAARGLGRSYLISDGEISPMEGA